MRVLVSWLGTADLSLMKEDKEGALASIALRAEPCFDKVIILANDFQEDWDRYLKWIGKKLAVAGRPFKDIEITSASIASPIDYQSITQLMKLVLVDEVASKSDSIAINLTSGTPAMTAVSVLIGKGLANCEFYQSSKEQGVQTVDVPIDFKSKYREVTNERLTEVTGAQPKVESAFDTMVCHSEVMKQCIRRAKKLAKTELPALVLGETGTGKERLAEAIHKESQRIGPLKTINCGAIPESLIDSTLFGHKKGAFTGAVKDQAGLFEEANGGTVFLDEVGELSLDAQVKLLRVLQQKEVVPVGSGKELKVNIRIIAATHRNLLEMVESGEFREDLYYRLAVGVIELPPLRDRKEDIPELIEALMEEINRVAGKHLTFDSKNIYGNVIKFAVEQSWPGNIRELWNTLSRAVLWSEGDNISLSDIKSAIQERVSRPQEKQQELSRGNTVDLNQVLDSISKNYILKALELTGNNKSKASKMLGLANHQTLLNRMKKLGIEN